MVDQTTEREELRFGNTSQHYHSVLILLSLVSVGWRVEESVEGGRNDANARIWIVGRYDGRNDVGGSK